MASPINICFPVNYLGYGGAERQLVDLAQGLDKDLFQVMVVTLQPGGPLEGELRGQEGISIETVARKNKYDVSPIISMSRLLQRHRSHVVQPFLSPATLFGLAASFVSHTPVRIVTERCGLRRNRGLGNKLYRTFEDRLTRFADLAVANSEAGREYLHARGIRPAMTRVIYNGINLERLQVSPDTTGTIRERLGVPSNGIVIGNVASLTRPKDQATIIRAAASLVPEFPDLRVALVGDGPLRGELEKLAQDLGVSTHVVFFGSQRRVADYIAAFDMAVLSSVDNEGCSNFLLEAMALGKPVVASDIGGNCELVQPGENGLIVPPADAGALAKALRDMLESSEARSRMGARGLRFAKDGFSMSDMVQAYQDMYTELASRKLDRSRTSVGRVA